MMVGPHRWSACLTLLVAGVLGVLPAQGGQIVYPTADGTLADGGIFGPLDGVADSWHWTFGPAGFAGAVTRTTETAASAVEHRMVFEYDLRNLTPVTPLAATLTFTTRGVRVFPFPDVTLHVYTYPADLLETPGDYSAAPTALAGVVTVAAMQNPTTETLDVSSLVESAWQSGVKRVAFRFQIDPGTPHAANQVFIDALDAEPATKPLLTIGSAVPGDADEDGDADLNDFAIFVDCLSGPAASPAPAKPGISGGDCLWAFDRDLDADVDLEDLSLLLGAFASD